MRQGLDSHLNGLFIDFFNGCYSGSDLDLGVSPVRLHCAKRISTEVTESRPSSITQKWVCGSNTDESAVALAPVCLWPGALCRGECRTRTGVMLGCCSSFLGQRRYYCLACLCWAFWS